MKKIVFLSFIFLTFNSNSQIKSILFDDYLSLKEFNKIELMPLGPMTPAYACCVTTIDCANKSNKFQDLFKHLLICHESGLRNPAKIV